MPKKLWHYSLLNGAVLSLAVLLVLSGCSAPNVKRAEVLDPVKTDAQIEAQTVANKRLQEDLVAKDLIFVYRQLTQPTTTTVQLANSDDSFQTLLLNELIVEGYGIQQVDADQGANFLSYKRQADSAGDQIENTYSLTIGDIELMRSYVVRENGGLFPVSAMTLAGSRIPAKIDRSLFKRLGNTTVAVDNIKFTSAAAVDTSGIPTISLITSDVVSGVTSRAVGGPSTQALNSSKVEVGNLFYGESTNFGSALSGFKRTSRDIVPFGDDELRLGKLGKRMVIAILNSYDEHTDRISVVGCSNGATQYKGGNEGLALGRAARVTEEFLSHGVARDRIFDEGCWAPISAGDRFPSRGVVVELWRKSAR